MTTLYGYDALNQLTKVQSPSHTEDLHYDRAGNRTRRVSGGMEELYAYNLRNRLTEYTKGGQTTTFTYDRAGNLLSDNKAGNTYDAFNRTEKVETFDGHVQINRYDAEGLRHELEALCGISGVMTWSHLMRRVQGRARHALEPTTIMHLMK